VHHGPRAVAIAGAAWNCYAIEGLWHWPPKWGVGPLDWDWGILSGSLGPRLRLLRNYLQAQSIAVSEPFGLPLGSLTVMSLIAANAGSSQTQLAEWAGITGPGLVGIVDDLEERGLVTRIRSQEDRRRNMLVLTPKGERTMATMFAAVTNIEGPMREALGPEDMDKLVSLIDKSLDALRQDVP
jgi:DNA-binding MarR family transcriptional regulator